MLSIVWFRQDLRIKDNPALTYAVKQGEILPIYIVDTDCPEACQLGGASKWWLHQSLTQLNQALEGTLQFFKGSPLSILEQLAAELGADTLVWNRCYEPWQISRDSLIKQAFSQSDLQVKSFNASLLWEPWQVLKNDNTPYKVFTPYYRRGCLRQPSPRLPTAEPEQIQLAQSKPQHALHLDELQLMPEVCWFEHMAQVWTPGEEGAAQNLSQFVSAAVSSYKDQRNIPAVTGTSKLSPHLHFGEVSPNQIWYAAIDSQQGRVDDPGLDCYLSELGWREFSYYLLYHFPHIPQDNFNTKFDAFPWKQDEDALKAWQTGNTGIPIVDAGMRELWQTGYMHNRVRMIVGSFLVKNLLLDWRQGERWFWDCLLDADLASNSASWQWVAGSGADAAPYFRIFNPILQGEKFDKTGEYVKRYCPELSQLPAKFIHKPWEASSEILQAARVSLGGNYPAPIVDLKLSRQRALDAFACLKEA